MSGDVQPRRRKDKKKKRAEEGVSSGEETAPAPAEPQWTAPSGGEWMHTQSDHGTGGHWCAKIIFFLLLSVLITLISLIILENRGLQDLEERDATESRYAAVFDGWLEEEIHDDHHDPHTLELKHPEEQEDDHEHPSDLEDEIEEIEKDIDSREHDDHGDDDADEHNDNDDDDDDDEDHEDDSDDDDDDNKTDNDDDEGDSDEGGDDDKDETDERSDEADDDQHNYDDDDDDENDTDEGDDDEEENDHNYINGDNENDQDDDDDEIDDYLAAEKRVTIEYVRYDKPLEEVDDDDTEEVIDNHAAEEEHLARLAAEQDDELETSNMGLKFGVGVALVVVAHWVLVRKWRNDRNNEAADGNGNNNLHRRLTLVEDGEEPEHSTDARSIKKSFTGGSFATPKSTKPVVSFSQNIETLEEESHTEDDSDEQSEDETIAKKLFTNVLTSAQCPLVQSSPVKAEEEKEISEDEEPDEEEVEIVEKINVKDVKVPDRELISDDEDLEEETEDNDDYEHVDEEEENVEEQEDEEISDVDDDELMKKLEQKYGKLPAEKR